MLARLTWSHGLVKSFSTFSLYGSKFLEESKLNHTSNASAIEVASPCNLFKASAIGSSCE